MRTLPILCTVLALAGCASTASPVIYQPPGEPAAPHARIAGDLQACRAQALQAVGLNGNKGRTTAVAAGRAGAIEFVDKAVEALVAGSRNAWERGRGGAAGEASGSLVGVLLNWNEPDRVHREHVDLCLKRRGHTVLGWR